MSSIAIITARGGSKRIPRKNIKVFIDKPSICYAIEAALESKAFDIVMVSTDDEEIASIAEKAGAQIPFKRSSDNSGDFATTTDVVKEVLDNYSALGQEFEKVAVIYPTAPFVTAEKLRTAIEMLDDDNTDSVLPVVKFSFPPQRAFVIHDNYLEFSDEKYAMARSQDLEPYYHDCGQFCCFKPSAFYSEGRLVTKKTKAIVCSELEVQDIDTIEDWKIAEIKYAMSRDKQ